MDERAEQGLTRAELEDDEDLALGHAYLDGLTKAADGMVELAPGVWYAEKREDDRGLWI